VSIPPTHPATDERLSSEWPASWTVAHAARGAAIAAFLIGQIGLCVYQLTQPRPSRFGWQMFSGIRNPIAYKVLSGDGSAVDVRVAEFVPHDRAEIDLQAVMVRAICERRTDAVAVAFRFASGAEWQEQRCRR
jgi:hypothetical protein